MFDSNDLKVASGVQEVAAKDMRPQVRLVAGPGTGKSQTIEQRVGELLSLGVDPKEMAIISFTNASVRDLRGRIIKYCEGAGLKDAKSIKISTLHALALGVLRANGKLEQYAYEPKVLSEFELDFIHDDELGHVSSIKKKARRKEVRQFIEAIWSTGDKNAPTYTPPDPPITDEEEREFRDYHNPTCNVYCCVLPGEIVKLCVDLTTSGLISPADTLAIKFLIVDEYQDLSPVDIEFVDQIARAGVNTFVAGDDDQSIYSFRHGSPVGIQTFEKKYTSAGLHVLDHCFRCATSILTAAQKFISTVGIPNRILKNPISMYKNSSPTVAGMMMQWSFPNATSEGEGIASSCKKLCDSGVAPNEILILVPNTRGSADIWPKLENALNKYEVPYEGPKDSGFLTTETGQLLLAILRIVCSRNAEGLPEDVVAHRLLYGLTNGVGIKACNTLRQHVLDTVGVTYLDLFYKPIPSTISNKALERVRENCGKLKAIEDDGTLVDKKDEIASIVAILASDKAGEEVKTYLESFPEGMFIRELLGYTMASNDEQRWAVIKAVHERLAIDLPENDSRAEPKAKVMTLHSAKGLSARVVFVVGLDEGVLPNERQNRSTALGLESARLLFVAITRARAACILSTARTRLIQGINTRINPSRWLALTGVTLEGRTAGLTDAEVQTILVDIGNL